jgi:hypothetical protein
MTLEYVDLRFGDTFIIDIDLPSGEVHGIVRYIDRIGRDPIYYDVVEELPGRVREEIQTLITKRCQK